MDGRIKISEEVKEDIGYRSVIKGESRELIAKEYGISKKTVSKYAGIYRDKNEFNTVREDSNKCSTNFKSEWDEARFKLNPNAKRGD